MYDANAMGRPRFSIFWDEKYNRLISAKPIWGRYYVIPRWQIVQNQYAYSPAVIAALPDARLIQAMTFTLLESSEKAANPPLIATKDTVRSDMAVFAGGVTWVDQDYDERLGSALRPISQDYRGINYGVEMAQDTRALIHQAFFLDKLTLPQRTPEMTAYEVSQRVQEYIRNALPLFSPMEQEYNAALCEETFHILLRNGAFGSPQDWPRRMRGIDVEFHFESPLHDVIEQEKSTKWQEAVGMLSSAVALDPSTAFVMDVRTAFRDALLGAGCPATWTVSEDEVDRAVEAHAEQVQQEQLLEQLKTGSEAAQNLSSIEAA